MTRQYSDQEIKDAIELVQDRLRYLYHDFEKDRNKLRDEIKDIQEVCQHNDAEYHPDPSGNRDSSRSCNVCGKDIW